MKVLLVFLGFVSLMLCEGRETCTGLDITDERQFPIEKLDGLWYLHFLEDNTFFSDIIPVDGQFFITVVKGAIYKYYYGRENGGKACVTTIFVDNPVTPRSVCYSVRILHPLFAGPAEFIYVLFPGDDKLMIASCVNPPSCTQHTLGGLTRRKTLCKGEREMFNRKLRQLGFPVTYKKADRPASNDCKPPGVTIVDKKAPACKRKYYRY